MVTVHGGKIICDNCGRDCTKLYGLKFEVRTTKFDKSLQTEVERIDKIFGKHDFVFCWECCIRSLGAKPVENIEEKVIEPVKESIFVPAEPKNTQFSKKDK